MDCHVLFVSKSEEQNLAGIMDWLKGKSILTVSDLEGFAQRGGMIRFITERNKIRFRINLESVKASKLSLSSKLLRAAEIVGTVKE